MACESTTESAPRRAFLVGAAAAMGVAAIGLPLLAKAAEGARPVAANLTAGCSSLNLTAGCDNFNLTAGCNVVNLTAGNNIQGCNIVAAKSVVIDTDQVNPGNLVPGLVLAVCKSTNTAVSGISSSSVSCAPNFLGLDFYTGSGRRMGINSGGCVAIHQGSACTEKSALNNGTLSVSNFLLCTNETNLGPGPGRPSIAGNSGRGSGIVGSTEFIPCLKTPNLCNAGVVGLSVGANGSLSTGKGIGVRGSSTEGAGVAGTSCISSGVVGVSGILPCIRPQNSCVAGVVGLSLGSTGTVASGKGIGVRGVSGLAPGISGASCLNSGVIGTTGSTNAFIPCIKAPNECIAGVTGLSLGAAGCINLGTAAGVRGRSAKGPAVQGQSQCNAALCGQSSVSTVARLTNNAKVGDKSTLIQFNSGCSSVTGAGGCLQTWSAGVAGAGNADLVTAGSFYIGKPGKPSIVLSPTGVQVKGTITSCGGISNNGGLTAKTITLTGSQSVQNYQMRPSCFAVLADSSGVPGGPGKGNGGTLTVTLPAAAASPGMLVFINKTDSSKNSVTVAAGGGDSICGAPSESLVKQYDSIELISDGKNTWYEISSY